jgi:hypothetical protein
MEINLIGNIEGAMEKLRNTHLSNDELNKLFSNFCNFSNGNSFNIDILNEELFDNINAAIEKQEKESFIR